MSHIALLRERYETYRAEFSAAAIMHPTNNKLLSFTAWRCASENEIRCARCNINEDVIEMTFALPHPEGLIPATVEKPKLLCNRCYAAIVKGMTACWNEVV